MANYGRFEIPLDLVKENPWQTRPINLEKVAELAADIRENGLLQPPVGRVVNLAGELVPWKFWEHNNGLPGWLEATLRETGFTVQIAFGHHRLAAYNTLVGDGLTPDYVERFGRFPVEIQDLTDEKMAIFGWSENERRGDLSDVEKALAMQRYMTDFGWTQSQVAEKLGISRPAVANKLRTLKLGDSDLTRPIYVAWAKGQISERQAMAALPLLDQPAEVIARAEQVDYSYRRPSQVIERIIKGDESSDRLRVEVQEAVDQGMVVLDGSLFLEEPFEGEGYQAQTCQACPFRIKGKDQRTRCQRPACYEKKNQTWHEKAAAVAMEKSGLPLVVRPNWNAYKSFYGEDAKAIQHVFETKRCENMRLREGGGGAEIPGVKGYELICLHGDGKRCTCLAAELKRRKKEDPEELAKQEHARQAKDLVAQAILALAQALSDQQQGAWYQLAKREFYDFKEYKIKPETPVQDIIRAFARRMIENKLPEYLYQQDPEQVKKIVEEFFSVMGIRIDGTELSPAEGAWGKFERVTAWMHDLPRQFPTLEMLRGNIANLEQLVETPGLEQAQWEQIGAARDQLEQLLPIVEGWTADDKFSIVNWLVSTPLGDINFKSELENATAAVIRYALIFIPAKGNKIEKLQKRLGHLPKTMAEVFAADEAADETEPTRD